jgi:hypothetical protein
VIIHLYSIRWHLPKVLIWKESLSILGGATSTISAEVGNLPVEYSSFCTYLWDHPSDINILP